jgi:hypothetical protein
MRPPRIIVIDSGWLIILGVLFFVGLFNIGLMLNVLRNRGRQEPFLRGSLADLLNPWKKEDEALDQLHREVEKLGGHPEKDMRESHDG